VVVIIPKSSDSFPAESRLTFHARLPAEASAQAGSASLHSATPKRKNVPCISDFRGGGFFLKMGRTFFFRGSAQEVSGQCGGAKCGLGFAKTIFWGKGFGKTSANFCFCILSARRRCGGNSARRAQSVPFGYFQTDTAFWLKSELTLTSIRTRNEPPRRRSRAPQAKSSPNPPSAFCLLALLRADCG